jgi:hypothetical protein
LRLKNAKDDRAFEGEAGCETLVSFLPLSFFSFKPVVFRAENLQNQENLQ